jgi:hypothetical protein
MNRATLSNYRLNPTVGPVIGFTPEGWSAFVAALQQLASEGEARLVEESEYGRKYLIRGPLSAPGMRPAEVDSVWIVRAGDDRPRLVTVYPR